MIIELKQRDIVTLLKAIRDKQLDTDDIDDLRGYKQTEFKGFNFLPWTPANDGSKEQRELADRTRYQNGQDNAHLHGYIDDGSGGYIYVGVDEAMKRAPFK